MMSQLLKDRARRAAKRALKHGRLMRTHFKFYMQICEGGCVWARVANFGPRQCKLDQPRAVEASIAD
jgi:hypothetical protein